MDISKIKLYVGGVIAISVGILTLLALNNTISFGDYIMLSIKGLIGIGIVSKSIDILTNSKTAKVESESTFQEITTIKGGERYE